jgi:HrpA-like RNA helicase
MASTWSWSEWEAHEYDIKKTFSQTISDIQEFWSFAKAYMSLKKNDRQNERVLATTFTERYELPLAYHERYRIPFILLNKSLAPQNLPDSVYQEVRQLLHLYIDYQQKKTFQKILKIRHDREQLPIKAFQEEIVHAVREYQVVLIAGDTGCGKSTQVPQYLMEAGFRKIACTQPRRIACQALAKRVAYETLQEHGLRIAYQIRFEGTKTRATRILFLTEGVLLRQCAVDPLLMQYDVVILDEVHERHITCDFLLGILKRMIRDRPLLKLVLMSATINYELFSRYFDSCRVIKIPGRMYPVDVEYCPIGDEDGNLVDEKRIEERMASRNRVSILAKPSRVDAGKERAQKALYKDLESSLCKNRSHFIMNYFFQLLISRLWKE